MGRSAHAVGLPVATRLTAGPNWGKYVELPNNLTVTTLTASATPHTPGAWTEIYASTSADADMLYLALTQSLNVNGQNTSILVDVAVGAASSEVAILSGYNLGGRSISTLGSERSVRIPVFIPKGSRVSARIQGTQVSETVAFVPTLLRTGLPTSTNVLSWGADTATSQGVATVQDTWVEITSGVSEPLIALFPSVGIAGSGVATETDIELGIGAAGFETSLGVAFRGEGGSLEQTVAYLPGLPIYAEIPTGTRVAVRRSGSTTAFNVVLHGIRRRVA